MALAKGELEGAKRIIEVEYPYKPLNLSSRKYIEYQATKIFARDGFIDRYSGKRLVFPPVLRLLSALMPEVFPFQKNWKMTECHIAYWQLSPTIDHIVPIARGGEDKEKNWITTSMLRNNAKSNWLLEELGWKLYPPGELTDWDGLIHWFMEYAENHPEILNIPYIYKWHKALIRAIEIKG
jgi:5-methylcytosine-specific restriction endonuclease McrA